LLSADFSPVLHDSKKLIWHPQVPLKVSILAWRLLRDRLPTKSNLLRRGIIHDENTSCVAGCGCIESVQHLFISCDFLGTLWHHVRQWLGLSGVDHNDISTHFAQCTNYLDRRRRCRSFLQLLWLMCVWLIWKERNNRVFTNVHISIKELKEKVNFHSYWWLKANNASFVYGCEQWRSDPLFCLGIGWCSFLYLSLQTSCILSALFSTPCALEVYPSLVIYSILASSQKKSDLYYGGKNLLILKIIINFEKNVIIE